ncbi:trafficking protein particle complex subunit 9 [Octopus sinensis]|uniref:Trafficking protein particle complex subunit 9 n=1 Tax=Octopus sinensis TaxID=2607531 RepID=A0A6P7TFZ7_9MOLL|nr:trafficking protein particle complex subunit 9 [Octopus sinensis]
MSCIDYSQTAENHQCLLILVKHVGTQLHNKTFLYLWERVRRVSTVHIPNHQRTIWLRYKRVYPVDNNEWGDFQAHRKVLGIICVGKCRNMKEFEEIFENYKKIKEDYASTIFNSRLIVFGMNRDGTPMEEIHSEEDQNQRSQTSCDLSDTDTSSKSNASSPDCDKSLLDNSPSSTIDSDSSLPERDSGNNNPELPTFSRTVSKENTGAEVVFYPDTEGTIDLEERLRELIISLFFVLEGKRLDRSFERTEKLQMLCAPFEKRDLQGIDTDSKAYKKKCTGRLRKHLADLCLQAGLPGEAILHYQTSLDILKTVNDWLWIGACYEGLSSSSVILTYPQQTGSPTLRRNLSFCVKRSKSKMDEIKSRTGVPLHIKRSISNGYDGIGTQPKSCLDPDDIIEKYKEAIMQYSKSKAAAVIEMEASIKACRVLILQRKYLQASDFLQNVMYINVQSTNEDKIQRYSTLASLYSQICFHRKAAFYRRITALQSVNPQVAQPNWYQCYTLLLQALDGYGVTMDPRQFTKNEPCGWPVLQMKVLQELIFSAKRMGNPQLSVRHMTFLLHSMLDHMSPQERRDVATTLKSNTARCEGIPQPLATDSGIIFPPVSLTKLPIVKSFKLINVAGHCCPVKLPSSTNVTSTKSDCHGLFIYTPLTFGEVIYDEKVPSKVDFRWVAGDVCEVHLEVYNPMPDDLHVTQMSLLTDGVDMDVFPINAEIPAESKHHLIKLSGIPKTSSDLNIYGYVSHVYGVRSHCKLKDIPYLHNVQHVIEVVPALPHIQVSTNLPKAPNSPPKSLDGKDIVASAVAVLYAGQSVNWIVTINNIGSQKVEMLELSLSCKTEHRRALQKVVLWNQEAINCQLPLKPDESTNIPVSLNGYNYFNSDLDYSDASSFTPTHSNTATSKSSTAPKKSIEATVTISYSGGPGYRESFCRQCAISLHFEVLPTVTVQRWDVVPGGSYDRCFLLFDLLNQSGHQIEVQYTDGGHIIIEPSQCRRIGIPFTRCHLPEQDDQCVVKKATTCDVVCPVVIEPVDVWKMYIFNCIDIRWSIPAVNATGKVSLDNIVWGTSQMNLMKLSPIKWTVVVNSQFFDVTNVPQVTVGELTSLHITMMNADNVDAYQAELNISCYQDLGCGSSWYSTEQQSSIIGIRSLKIDKLAQGNSISHECHLLFYHSGVYKFDIQCAYQRQPSKTSRTTASKCTTLSPVTKMKDNSYGGDGSTSQAAAGEPVNLGRTSWKCTPIVLIKVLESRTHHL